MPLFLMDSFARWSQFLRDLSVYLDEKNVVVLICFLVSTIGGSLGLIRLVVTLLFVALLGCQPGVGEDEVEDLQGLNLFRFRLHDGDGLTHAALVEGPESVAEPFVNLALQKANNPLFKVKIYTSVLYY